MNRYVIFVFSSEMTEYVCLVWLMLRLSFILFCVFFFCVHILFIPCVLCSVYIIVDRVRGFCRWMLECCGYALIENKWMCLPMNVKFSIVQHYKENGSVFCVCVLYTGYIYSEQAQSTINQREKYMKWNETKWRKKTPKKKKKRITKERHTERMCTKRSRKITFQAKAFQLLFFFLLLLLLLSCFVREKQPKFGHSMPQWLNSTHSRTAHNLYYTRNRETNNEYTREYYEESDCRHVNEWTNEPLKHTQCFVQISIFRHNKESVLDSNVNAI